MAWVASIVSAAGLLILADAALAKKGRGGRDDRRGDFNSNSFNSNSFSNNSRNSFNAGNSFSSGNSFDRRRDEPDSRSRSSFDDKFDDRAKDRSGRDDDSKDFGSSEREREKNSRNDRDDDEDRDSQRGDSGSKAARKAFGAGDTDDSDPPRTVVEAFQRWLGGSAADGAQSAAPAKIGQGAKKTEAVRPRGGSWQTSVRQSDDVRVLKAGVGGGLQFDAGRSRAGEDKSGKGTTWGVIKAAEGSGAQGEPAPGALPSQTERRLSQGDSFGRGNSEFGKRKSDDGSDDADRGKTAGRLDQRAQDGRPGAGQVPDEPSRARRAAERLRNPSLGWQREMRASDPFRRDELLVLNASQAALAKLRFEHVETIKTGASTVSRFLVPDGLDATAARQLLSQEMPALLSAFNYVYRPYVPSTDGGGRPAGIGQVVTPSLARGCSPDRCYGPSLVNWQPDPNTCTVEVGVGVIDTGFDAHHPVFKDRRINWGTVLEGEHASVQAWHGTGVLALLSGDPQSGMPGLIPNAAFTVANTFYADAKGQPATDTTTLIKALRLMESYKVKVVNLSLAGPHDPVLHEQIRSLSAQGMLFVAAVGNGGPFAAPSYPAAYPEVIAVTAVDRNLAGYRHANRGPYVDLAAPGVDIWTALPDNKEGPQTGTSFAVPYVTAAAAAVYPREELVYKGRPLDPKRAVLKRLSTRDLGPAGKDPIYGQGLLLAPPKCAGKPGSVAPVEVSAAWSPTLQPVARDFEPAPASSGGLMSLTPSAEARWPGVVQHLSFQPDN